LLQELVLIHIAIFPVGLTSWRGVLQ